MARDIEMGREIDGEMGETEIADGWRYRDKRIYKRMKDRFSCANYWHNHKPYVNMQCGPEFAARLMV
jgi:hypothetical protein